MERKNFKMHFKWGRYFENVFFKRTILKTKGGSQYFYTPVILIDSVYRKDKNYYSKVFLEKYYFIEDIEIYCSNSDEEYINSFYKVLKKKKFLAGDFKVLTWNIRSFLCLGLESSISWNIRHFFKMFLLVVVVAVFCTL